LPNPAGHLLLVHHSDGERLRWLAQWCAAGLDGGEQVVYVDVAGWGTEQLTNALADRGLDVTSAVKNGRFCFVGAETVLGLGSESDDVVTAALQQGFDGVRLAVRQDALAESLGPGEAELVEQRLEALCSEAPLSVACQYDGRLMSDAWLVKALDLHPHWVVTTGLSLHRSGHVIQVEGRLDVWDEELLVRSLQRMTRHLSLAVPLLIDLRRAELVSVAVARAVIRGTEAFRARSGLTKIGLPEGSGADLVRLVQDTGDVLLELD
jgi:hypothetical protein